jgi:hypothetical protein
VSRGSQFRSLPANSCARGILQSIFLRTQACTADFLNRTMILRETSGCTIPFCLAHISLFRPREGRIASQLGRPSLTPRMGFQSWSVKNERPSRCSKSPVPRRVKAQSEQLPIRSFLGIWLDLKSHYPRTPFFKTWERGPRARQR